MKEISKGLDLKKKNNSIQNRSRFFKYTNIGLSKGAYHIIYIYSLYIYKEKQQRKKIRKGVGEGGGILRFFGGGKN